MSTKKSHMRDFSLIGNLDNLLEIVAEDIKKVRVIIHSEFGEVIEGSL